MKFLFNLFAIIFFASCNAPNKKDTPQIRSKQSLVNEVRNKTFLKLKEEKDLYPCGTGAGMMDQIRMLALSFHYYKEVEI